MQITSKFPLPGQSPARPTKVTDVAFDRGSDYYNEGGKLKERPSQNGLIMLNKVTLQAADLKITAIQNRVQDLTGQGVKPDAQGNFHYEDKSGEIVDVKKEGDATTYSQSLAREEHSWLKRDEGNYIESFRVQGDEVNAAVTNKHDEFYSLFGLPVSKHDTSETTLSWKYKHSSEGLQFFHSDKWQIAK